MATGMHERARPLADGRVSAQGIKLTTVMLKNNGARHDRFLNGEFDAAEISLALYLRRWSHEPGFEAIPVFLNRQFRHGAIFVNAASGIREPRDVEGKRIGIASWLNTAALWARGILQHEHGVDLTKVHWLTATLGESSDSELPPGIRMSDESRPFVDLLLAGELDVLITPRTIARDHTSKIVRLFPDFRRVESVYFRETGVFPMSHVLVVRTALLDAHPSLANSIFQAAHQAKEMAIEYADDPEHSMLAWFGADWEDETRDLGRQAWSYGVEPNRKTLETAIMYGHAGGLLKCKPSIEDLFHPSSRALVPNQVD
jgi:4,5-dihydroxyphthalate decarboxylase